MTEDPIHKYFNFYLSRQKIKIKRDCFYVFSTKEERKDYILCIV